MASDPLAAAGPLPSSSQSNANIVASFLLGDTPHTSASSTTSSNSGTFLAMIPRDSARSLSFDYEPVPSQPMESPGPPPPSESSIRSGTTYPGTSVQVNPPSSIASSIRSASMPGNGSTPPSSVQRDSIHQESLTGHRSARPSSHRSFSRGSYQGQPGHTPPSGHRPSDSDTPRSAHDTYSQGTSTLAARNSMTGTIPSIRSFGNLSSSSAGADETRDEFEHGSGGRGHQRYSSSDVSDLSLSPEQSGRGPRHEARFRPRPASTTGATAGSTSSSEPRPTDVLLPSPRSFRGGGPGRSGSDRGRGARAGSKLRKALTKGDCCKIS